MPYGDGLAGASLEKVSNKLAVLEHLRGVSEDIDIDLPGVVVVGEQSCGKSSLIENVSGIQFPRAQNTCTRMPCVLQLLSDSEVQEPYAQVSMDSKFTDAS